MPPLLTQQQLIDAGSLANLQSHELPQQLPCPNVSMATITKVVAELRKAGVLYMTGTGADIHWGNI